MDVIASMETGKLPDGYTWLNEPESWEVSNGALRITPRALTDLFRSPDGGEARDNACLLCTSVSGDFTAVAHLRANLVGFGDAGGITLRTLGARLVRSEDAGSIAAQIRRLIPGGFGGPGSIAARPAPTNWAKLCLERSPIGDVSIVSVVTRDLSDDSNGELLDGPECWLRLTRKGAVYGMHHSLDGTVWRFARTFTLGSRGPVLVGIQAQAPFTGGCRIEFHHFSIALGAVADFRSGA